MAGSPETRGNYSRFINPEFLNDKGETTDALMLTANDICRFDALPTV